MSLTKLFCPSSVAVIGASRKEGHIGRIVINNLIESFEGDIYPVNPKGDRLEGLKCYDSITDVPAEVDLTVIAVPARVVPDVFRDCADSGIKNAIVVSGGFKEVGEEGAKLEKELAEIAEENGINLIGPNSLGVISTASNLNATFAREMAIPGNISFMSQSGAFCTAVLDWANEVGRGFNHFVSLGNKAVLDEVDLIKEWDQDDNTDVILGYIEGIQRGSEFIEVAKEVTKTTPIVVVKSGKTEEGASAAISHTGTISGSDEAYDAAFAQSGVIRAQNVEEMFDYGSILANQDPPKNRKVGILTNSGGPGIMATDALVEYGLELAKLEESTLEKLDGVLSSLASRDNPVDLTGKADEEDYREALEYMIEDDNVGSVVALSAPAAIVSFPVLTEILAEAREKTDKPIVGTLMGGQLSPESQANLESAGVPNYFDPARAVRALSALVKYGDIQEMDRTPPTRLSIQKDKAQDKLEELRSSGDRVIGLEGLEVLDHYGIPTISAKLARTPEEAADLAENIGSLVVLKVDSPQIVHKSDAGGVKVGVEPADVAWEFQSMMETLNDTQRKAEINGIRVQEMVEGEEVIVGLKRDPQFGPLIMFGLGGIYVEVMEDVSFRVAPVSTEQAREMVESINGYPILKGVRGKEGVDVDSLVELVQRVSQFASDNPEIGELDLNPVMASSEWARVADARFRFSQ
ncbi:MAG: acetate--CoA ligase family protein [Candidatus Bipolaricaulota bacterium]|nr:acetate--CoA ligase family protein [Candidatus Bipolaricaulota bacterium]